MKKFYKIAEKSAYAFICIIAILMIWSFLPVKNAPKIFIVLSGSMEPAIHTGSVVIIKPVSQYKIGDVITFGKNKKEDIPTTHRIVFIKKENDGSLFTTKGDANNSTDVSLVKEKDVHGKVLVTIPYLGYVIDFVRKPLGMLMVIILPSILVIYDETIKILKEIKKLKEPDDTETSNDQK